MRNLRASQASECELRHRGDRPHRAALASTRSSRPAQAIQYPPLMDPIAATAGAEYVCVDTETNGRAGEDCELIEVGAVLVGGGELHDRFESLVRTERPLSRGIERFTGITQAMVDDAPPAGEVLPRLKEMVDGRVLVAHSASFDRRVLAQAYERAGIEWTEPPILCTVAMARRFAPLARQRKLA